MPSYSGSTHCLMSEAIASELGVGLQRLVRLIWFEQMDRSLLGGQPAMHVTEKVVLEISQHREVLRFVVVP